MKPDQSIEFTLFLCVLCGFLAVGAVFGSVWLIVELSKTFSGSTPDVDTHPQVNTDEE